MHRFQNTREYSTFTQFPQRLASVPKTWHPSDSREDLELKQRAEPHVARGEGPVGEPESVLFVDEVTGRRGRSPQGER